MKNRNLAKPSVVPLDRQVFRWLRLPLCLNFKSIAIHTLQSFAISPAVMKKTHSLSHFNSPYYLDRKWVLPLTFISTISLVYVLLVTFPHAKSSSWTDSSHGRSNIRDSLPQNGAVGLPTLPRFAYLISGSKGDGPSISRLLQAVYHPRNYYLLHLDLEASDAERLELAKDVKSKTVIRDFRNVMVVGNGDLITAKGPTAIASTLHSIAILLKRAKDWDWFINLSASDYPLVTQDDLLHVFSYLPRTLNFVEHTSNLGWNENQRARHVIIDPALYHTKRSGVFWATEKRAMPTSFKIFTGSTWLVLTKSFLEFCVWGWDNLPRTLLMYYTNFLASSEGYFHSVICNHKDYQNTTVNHDLHYVKMDNPPSQGPLNLTLEHWSGIVDSGAPFARKFARGDPVLDKIDEQLLRRSEGRLTPGGWCVGREEKDLCLVYGNPNVVKPSLGSKRLEKFMVNLLDEQNFRPRQCK